MNEPRGSVTGKRIILEIVREMREGLHPLLYSRVAPGLYCVYLHPEDFARIEGLVPRIRAEAGRALSDELSRLNGAATPGGGVANWFVAREDTPPIEEPAGGWAIQIEPDRDDEVPAGSFVILSKLTLPPLPQFEGGSPTTKVFKTVVSGEKRSKTEQVFKTPPALVAASDQPVPAASGATPAVAAAAPSAMAGIPPQPPPLPPSQQPPAQVFSGAVLSSPPAPRMTPVRGLAEIALADNLGPRVFVMDKPDIKIGRGGQFRLVDLQIDASIRISRVHARIRRDDRGRFFIKDLSEWGTTVDGHRIARGVTKEGDEVREIDVEAELPPHARIGLADVLFLEFTAAPSSVDARTSEIPTGVVTTSSASSTPTRTGSVDFVADSKPSTGPLSSTGTGG
jgi:pSer/pThr/pTyr-binding forkhead associated (FHA) protein